MDAVDLDAAVWLKSNIEYVFLNYLHTINEKYSDSEKEITIQTLGLNILTCGISTIKGAGAEFNN